ncbi:hypothetical protein OESDEN_00968 [Oesophagostomum dentatum]|uniref:Uncharacterized protein n=1 Tax=Oesophagostomum dentatum TaxID=61180 RepID=A0A0B1TNC1_OESDE|nr:hypothetical protein OESDEN_00968 [Oesophagostomum dentatum]
MKTEPSQERLQQSSSARDTRANQKQAPRQLSARRTGVPPRSTTTTTAHQNAIIHEDEGTNVDDQKEASVVNNVTAKDRTMDPVLLTGTTTILAKNGSKPVRVLLDTGSQLSFIDSKFVAELELPVVNESKLRVKTFGSNRINEEFHRIVEVNLLDMDKGIHKFHLFDSPTITSHTILPPLTMEDLRVIQSKGIQLSSQLNDHRKPPQILLGCDQMWDMIENSIEKLPSGLHLIGTKFGHMISGRQQHLPEQIQNAVLLTEVEEKDQELEMFDKYWSLESSRTSMLARIKQKSSERTKKL